MDSTTKIYIKPELEGKYKQVADDWTVISIKNCRRCKEEIKPYKEVYVGKIYCASWIEYVYKYGCGYCASCAAVKAAEHNVQRHIEPPYVVDTIYGVHGKETKVYNNGLTVEELTPYDYEYDLYGGNND